MQVLFPKDFINMVLITEIQSVVINHPYLAFLLICSGIEFLGKCIDDENQEWDVSLKDQKQPPFDKAIEKLFPLKYKVLLDKYDLRDQLRNGLLHMYLPKSKIGLTQIMNDRSGVIKMDNHPYDKNGKLILVIEYFYIDFVDACKKVLFMDFLPKDKMNQPFLEIPS